MKKKKLTRAWIVTAPFLVIVISNSSTPCIRLQISLMHRICRLKCFQEVTSWEIMDCRESHITSGECNRHQTCLYQRHGVKILEKGHAAGRLKKRLLCRIIFPLPVLIYICIMPPNSLYFTLVQQYQLKQNEQFITLHSN